MSNDSDSLATKCQREIILHPQQNIPFGKSIFGTKLSSRQKNLLEFELSSCQVPHKHYFALINNVEGLGWGCMCHISESNSYNLQPDSKFQKRHLI